MKKLSHIRICSGISEALRDGDPQARYWAVQRLAQLFGGLGLAPYIIRLRKQGQRWYYPVSRFLKKPVLENAHQIKKNFINPFYQNFLLSVELKKINKIMFKLECNGSIINI